MYCTHVHICTFSSSCPIKHTYTLSRHTLHDMYIVYIGIVMQTYNADITIYIIDACSFGIRWCSYVPQRGSFESKGCSDRDTLHDMYVLRTYTVYVRNTYAICSCIIKLYMYYCCLNHASIGHRIIIRTWRSAYNYIMLLNCINFILAISM